MGQHEALEDALGPLFSSPHACTYPVDRASKINKAGLTKHKAVLAACQDAHRQLTFPPLLMKGVMKAIAMAKQAEWRFDEQDVEAWATEVSARVRCMCRHASQALRRKPAPPSWALEILQPLQPPAAEPDTKPEPAGTDTLIEVDDQSESAQAATSSENKSTCSTTTSSTRHTICQKSRP